MHGLLKWLKDNPLGLVLSAVCGVLLLCLLFLTILASLPPSVHDADVAVTVPDAGLNLPTLAKSPPFDSYSVVAERPLFNETRQPILEDTLEENPPLASDEDVELPEVELAGVVITPSLRMATLKRKDNALSLVAFEGMPIEADFGGWQVSHIRPRAVTLSSSSGGELELEMKVHDEKIEPPKPVEKSRTKGESPDGAQPGEADQQPLSRAEEIRQRIAERREELRREAEQAAQPEQDNEPPRYEQAIQNMISRNRNSKSGGENE